MPEMKVPGPDHPITVAAKPARVQVAYHGHVIVDSRRALELKEATYKPVLYFPREDVDMNYFSRTEHTTYCPYKGVAHYYTLLMDGRFAENAVWTYEAPFDGMDPIAGRLAFYTDRVEVYPVDDAAVNPRHHDEDVDEVVQHTDAGDGKSQREHWPPNAGTPDQPEGGLR